MSASLVEIQELFRLADANGEGLCATILSSFTSVVGCICYILDCIVMMVTGVWVEYFWLLEQCLCWSLNFNTVLPASPPCLLLLNAISAIENPLAGSGFVEQDEFERLWDLLMPHAPDVEKKQAYEQLDVGHDGRVDYINWTQRVNLRDAPILAERIRQQGLSCDSWQFAAAEVRPARWVNHRQRFFCCADAPDC